MFNEDRRVAYHIKVFCCTRTQNKTEQKLY